MDKQHLPEPNRWLIERGQRVNFGGITFHILNGGPDLARSYHVTRTYKLGGGDNAPRAEADLINFELRREWVTLFHWMTRLANGTCVTVRFVHGLPTSTIDVIEEEQAA